MPNIFHPTTDIVQNAIYNYYEDASTAKLTQLLEALSTNIIEGANCYIPYVTASDGSDTPLLKTLTTESKDNFVVCYTTLPQAAADDDPDVKLMESPLGNYFEACLQMEGITGIAVNPFDRFPFTLQKKMLQELLAANKEKVFHHRILVTQGDITKATTTAIVNAANESLLGGGGVDGAIHRSAGANLRLECQAYGGCKPGEAKITHGYKLSARYIIHTVGPIYQNGTKGEAGMLAKCYTSSLDLAQKHHIHSLAFPAISTGAYGYPLKEALSIALESISIWLSAHQDYGMEVLFYCYDDKAYNVCQELVKA